MSEYEDKAKKFLEDHGIRFAAKQAPSNSCPPWANTREECRKAGHMHGYRFSIELRGKTESGLRRLTFPFWGSRADADKGKAEASAYDVLACISSDAFCPDTFSDFCAEYGYDEDSRKAEKLFSRCTAFAADLKDFFTEDELTALSEIR